MPHYLYSVNTNDIKLRESLKNYNNQINKILRFFNVSNIKIRINVLNYDRFKDEYQRFIRKDINANVTGFIEDDKNEIILLDYNDYNYTTHYGRDYIGFIKVAIHEIVHIVHSIACKHHYPNKELWEGIAVYLSEQYDFENAIGSGEYYEYGLFIYKYLLSHTENELLNLLNVERTEKGNI